MNSRQREFLRKAAHDLEPMVRLGKDGFTDNQAQSILDVIESRELIKVKILQNSRVEKEEVAKEIEAKTGCEVVGIIGKTIILYKPNTEKPKISLEVNAIK
ncbi:ribosome assembly RNA-binding protein YhbY [Fusobacterium perfoetens]|uniref:ribosome assembly RNA-binding protein YhbY n=1 Tax=Fusobacterium perfoetens TaxID=852 RepID=UPI0015A25D14|nr:ribosome assembly RNA-binding protein YhbY [Fusobacterium perfoetens]MCF2625751.1 ribosome assembly RNA-binding protein YhbY [Fusobacterium perfoetens]